MEYQVAAKPTRGRFAQPPASNESGHNTPPLFNHNYLRRLKDGNRETQNHFACYFGRLLMIKLSGRLRSHHLREEVRQETLLRALMIVHRDGVRNPECLGSLVNSICNRVLCEVFRAEGRATAVAEVPTEVPDREAGPDLGLLSRERETEVRRILEQLGSRDRKLLQQVFLEERDKDDVCLTFRVSREYLRVLVHRAKVRFRERIQTSGCHSASRSAF